MSEFFRRFPPFNLRHFGNQPPDLQLCDTEFQTEGALMLKAFADNTSGIRDTESNNLSDNHNVHASR